MSYCLPISVGTFTKALGFAELAPTMLTLALFFVLAVLRFRSSAAVSSA